MPQQQERYHSNRADSTEAHRDDIDALVDQAIDDARADAERHSGCVTADVASDWLDEIDSVLEHNAEQFVSAYIQKGGQ